MICECLRGVVEEQNGKRSKLVPRQRNREGLASRSVRRPNREMNATSVHSEMLKIWVHIKSCRTSISATIPQGVQVQPSALPSLIQPNKHQPRNPCIWHLDVEVSHRSPPQILQSCSHLQTQFRTRSCLPGTFQYSRCLSEVVGR